MLLQTDNQKYRRQSPYLELPDECPDLNEITELME